MKSRHGCTICLDKQGYLPTNADPACSVADIQAKTTELNNVVSPIMHKPAPKPPKVEEPKEEEKPAEEKAEETPAEPMETDESDRSQWKWCRRLLATIDTIDFAYSTLILVGNQASV